MIFNFVSVYFERVTDDRRLYTTLLTDAHTTVTLLTMMSGPSGEQQRLLHSAPPPMTYPLTSVAQSCQKMVMMTQMKKGMNMLFRQILNRTNGNFHFDFNQGQGVVTVSKTKK